MVARNVNTNFSRTVRLKMNWHDQNNLKIYHRGLDYNIYDPVVDGVNLLKVPDYNTKKIDWVDVTYTAKSLNPNPLHERTERDINEELAIVDSKWRIMQDKLTTKDNNRLLDQHQPRNTLTKHGITTNHPYLAGEHDSLIDKMDDVHDIEVPVSLIKEQEKYFEKRQSLYKKTKLKFIEKLDQQTGEKKAILKMGYI